MRRGIVFAAAGERKAKKIEGEKLRGEIKEKPDWYSESSEEKRANFLEDSEGIPDTLVRFS